MPSNLGGDVRVGRGGEGVLTRSVPAPAPVSQHSTRRPDTKAGQVTNFDGRRSEITGEFHRGSSVCPLSYSRERLFKYLK